jgi:hypothetical protein
MHRTLKAAVVGGITGAFVAAATVAVAGTGVGGIFNLGQTNSVDAQSELSGTVDGPAQLYVNNKGSGPAVRGISDTGAGVIGQHDGTTGGTSGVAGYTSSTSPFSAGVLAQNKGGGPALRLFVNNTAVAPMTVNSTARVNSLNADFVDGQSASAFVPSHGTLGLWTSPYEYVTDQAALSITPDVGPTVTVRSSTIGSRHVYLALDKPAVLGTTLKLQKVTICFHSLGAPITGTDVYDGQAGQTTVLSHDNYTHSSPEVTCYDVAPSTPTVVAGVLSIHLEIYCGATTDSIVLYPATATYST